MENPSYHRKTPIVVTEKMRRQIAGAVAEIDLAQTEISRSLTPAERICQALSMIALAQSVAANHLRQREPHLSEQESLRIIRTGGIIGYRRDKHKPA
jgi:hypothetical protein